MATRSRRFMSQISGIALAAFVVASMSVHDHQAVAGAQNVNRTEAPAVVNAVTSVERQSQTLHATNVDFDGMVPTIIHHY